MTETDPTSPGVADARGLSPVIRPRPLWHWVVLAVSTFGLYLLYWYWMVWSYLRDRHGARVLPLVRSVVDVFVAPVFSYSLFRHLFDAARARGYPEAPPAGPLAGAMFGLWIASGISLRFGWLRMLQVLALLPAFETANFLFRTEWPNAPERRDFSVAELLVIGLGMAMWANLVFTLIYHPEAFQQVEEMFRARRAG